MGNGKVGRPKSSDVGRKEMIAERRLQVWKMRMQRMSIYQIEAALGVNKSTVDRDLDAMHALYHRETMHQVELWIALELEALDDLAIRNRALLTSTDPRALSQGITNAIALSAARRKLLGLDAPTRQEVTGSGGGAITIRVIEEEQPITDADSE